MWQKATFSAQGRVVKLFHFFLVLAIAWLPGCSRSVSERVIYEGGNWWSIRQVHDPHPAGGVRVHYRVYHRGKLVSFAPPFVERETSSVLSVAHFNPGESLYPELIVLVSDRFMDERGRDKTWFRAFRLISHFDRVEILPVAIP